MQNSLRPLAKCNRDSQNSRTRAAFCHAVKFLASQGWGVRELARYLGCAPSMVCEMQSGKRSVSSWAIGGLPPEGRQAFSAAYQALELPELMIGAG